MREPVVTLEELRGATIEGAIEYNGDVLLLLDRDRFCRFCATYDLDVLINRFPDLSAPPGSYLADYLADLNQVTTEAEAQEGRS